MKEVWDPGPSENILIWERRSDQTYYVIVKERAIIYH